MAGEVPVKSRGSDATKAQSYFERALAVARAQKAKSWELRAAMSMARLWRDQGKRPHLKTPGRWGGDPACRGNGVAAARLCSPSVRSPSVRPAASAALEANIKTLQAEIARLEAVVAGQRADLERERNRANVLGDELLKATLALPPSCRSTAALEGDRGGERRSRAWCAAPSPTCI